MSSKENIATPDERDAVYGRQEMKKLGATDYIHLPEGIAPFYASGPSRDKKLAKVRATDAGLFDIPKPKLRNVAPEQLYKLALIGGTGTITPQAIKAR